MGVAKDSLIRAHAGIMHVLYEFNKQGHCGTILANLETTTNELLEIPIDVIRQGIEKAIHKKEIVYESFNGIAGVMLSGLYSAELSIANRLKELVPGDPIVDYEDLDAIIHAVETKNNLQLSESQKAAVKLVADNKVAIITGGPGVGKTTIIKSILMMVEMQETKVMLCAPTGRAAKRLSESTELPAKTLHRLLSFDPKNHTFNYNTHNKLDIDLLVVDEVSMVDLLMMNNLLKALPVHCKIIFVGDMDQLPSVGPGSVLTDLIQSRTIPTAKLTKIFRQAAKSQIILNAHKINSGIIPKIEHEPGESTDFYFVAGDTPEAIQDKLIKIVSCRIPNRFNLDPVKQVQVLSPMNKGCLGVRSLNIELKNVLNQQHASSQSISRYGTTYSINDKVIQIVNNYDKEVFNGDIGFITEINPEESYLIIKFDDKYISYDYNEVDELMLAYATTIHKSQGSEYPAVVVPLAMQHFTLLERNLIYTAITRGKSLVVIVGQKKALAMTIKNVDSKQRITKLADRLKDIF